MKAQSLVAALAVAGATCAVAATASADTAVTAAAKGEPLVDHMVVTRDGKVRQRKVRAKRGSVEVDGRKCKVAAATPLAALLRTSLRPALRFHDYGSCSGRAADGSGLFVKAIGKDRNNGLNGWVYKVGRRLGTAGAADPSGPFGSGRLRGGQRVAWFYCVFAEGTCQRSLEVASDGDGVAVTAYDDAGDGIPAAGAAITARRAGAATVRGTAGADGRLALAAGTYTVTARKDGLIPSFPFKVTIGG